MPEFDVCRSLTFASLCTLAACSQAPLMPPFPVQHHTLVGHTDGRVRESLEPDEVKARGSAAGLPLRREAGAAQISRLMEGIRRSPHDTVLLYIHGGRVTYDMAYSRLAERGRAIDAAGYHPVFVHWNGSLSSSLWWHVFRMRQGEDWGPLLGPLSAPFVILADLGRGLARAPLTTVHQVIDYCTTLGGLARGDLRGEVKPARMCRVPGMDDARRQQAAFARRRGTPAVIQPGDTTDLLLGIGTHRLHPAETSLRIASGIVTLPSKLLLAPVADGFGAGAMGELRHRTMNLVHARADFASPPTPDAAIQPARGVVYAFVDSLRALIAEQRHDSLPPERRRRRSVILAGHSMGTLVLDQILGHFPDLDVGRIIYLAPASTVAELQFSVVRFLESHPRTTYYHGMLHPLADAGEWQPQTLDLVPRGSLLEWADDYLTSPATQLDRVSGKWANIVVATHIFTPAVRDRVVVKAFGVRDSLDARDPVLFAAFKRHGGFSDPRFAFWNDASWRMRPYRRDDGVTTAPVAPGLRTGGRRR